MTVQTTQPPVQDATVYVRLSSLCATTGSFAGCSGSFAVYPGMLIGQKCQEIANVISNNCPAAGYAVTANTCRIDGSFTASNVGCPTTQFALGLSNSPSVFDQAGLGPLPDGESDSTTGATGTCSPMPGAASNLLLTTANGDQDLLLTWDDATNADAYLIFSDTAPNGSFSTVAGSAPDGASGSMLGMPPGIEFYLVAGRNSTCGVGPKN